MTQFPPLTDAADAPVCNPLRGAAVLCSIPELHPEIIPQGSARLFDLAGARNLIPQRGLSLPEAFAESCGITVLLQGAA